MNALNSLTPAGQDFAAPVFFDEPTAPAEHYCKIYNDGSHYIASRCFRSEYRRTGHRTDRGAPDEFFDRLYRAAMFENLRNEALFEFIRSGFVGLEDETGRDLDAFVRDKIERELHNLYLRKKRFRRKAYLNRWNYFVTLTYDDEKCSEESFRKKLRTCLSHLHTRRGWKYMGVFERAPETGRLHFHGIFYIPDGEMLGSIATKKDYSTARHRMQTRYENSFFELRFGRNDFRELNAMEMKNGQTLNYVLKYIAKTGERIVYSRGIPSELYGKVDDSDIFTTMQDYITKYILFDDIMTLKHFIRQFSSKQLSIFDLPRSSVLRL